MTDTEILRACEMRLRGATWEQICNELHYADLGWVKESAKRRIFYSRERSRSLHPYVQSWMIREGITLAELAKEAGMRNSSVSTNLHKLRMSNRIVETICRMSGLTPEQAQALKEEE